MDTTDKQADFLYCEQIIRRHSNSFYYAFSQLPADKANAVFAIYAFCRTADDCADENATKESKTESLKKLRDNLDAFNRNEVPDEPLWRALDCVFKDYDMDIEPFYDQLKGQAMDIDFSIPKTMKDLEQYSYYVAGSVGLMLLPIIAQDAPHSLRNPAAELGIAMQITNILRDVGEDYFHKNRVYLPESELLKFHYTPVDLRAGIVNKQFIQLWEHLAVRAEQLYNHFMEYIAYFDADSQIPLSTSAQVYRGILDAVRNNGYQCLFERNYVNKEKMTEISAVISNTP